MMVFSAAFMLLPIAILLAALCMSCFAGTQARLFGGTLLAAALFGLFFWAATMAGVREEAVEIGPAREAAHRVPDRGVAAPATKRAVAAPANR